jgi:hypothetical protein
VKTIVSFFKKVASWFGSGKAESAFNTALSLVPQLQPIVEFIASMTPNKADDEIVAAYKQYGVPLAKELLSANGLDKGALLMNLATQVAQKYYPRTPTNIIQLAIQVAVTALKAASK